MRTTPLLSLMLLGMLLIVGACKTVKKGQASTTNASNAVVVPLVGNKQNHTTSKPYQASYKRKWDILHTKLDVQLNWKEKQLLGKADISLKPYFYATDSLSLDAKGFNIISSFVLNNQGDTLQINQHSYNGLKLTFNFDNQYTKKDTLYVGVYYAANPYQLAKDSKYYNYDNQGLYFINHKNEKSKKQPQQLWTQGETESSSCWFPTIDSPNERMTQEVLITVENRFVTLSNGLLIRSTPKKNGYRTDHWKQSLPHAPYLTTLAVSEYAIIKDEWNGIAVNYYVDPPYAEFAQQVFGNTPEMLTFFSELFDYPFPWEKYTQAVVHDFVAGAMENTTAVLYYDDLHMTDKELLERHQDDIIAHELVHHWFGNLVTCESWANLALNEGFATYGEYLWFNYKYGKDYADAHLHKDLNYYLKEANSKQVPIIRFYYDDREEMFDRHSYQKSGRVLHMLRYYIGDEAFFAAVSLYLKQRAYNTAEIHHLRMAFEEVTGEDLNWFFNQWFMQEGHPSLEIMYAYNETKKEAQVTIYQIQKNVPPFRLHFDIAVQYADSTIKRFPVKITDTKTDFTFKAAQAPLNINVDADKVLLCDKLDFKSVQGYLYQLQFAPQYMDKYEAIAALKHYQETDTVVQKALLATLEDGFWEIREMAIKNILTKGVVTKKKLIEKLIYLAINDPHHAVRTAALTKLGSLSDTTVNPTLTTALDDSSNTVVYTALYYLYQNTPSLALENAKLLEKNTNTNITNMLAQMYAEHGGPQRQAYFETKLSDQHIEDKTSLVQYYCEFIGKYPSQAIILKGAKTLEHIALHHPNWWMRLNATKNIKDIKEILSERMQTENTLTTNTSLLSVDNNEVDISDFTAQINTLQETLDRIISTERNERLLKFYQQL